MLITMLERYFLAIKFRWSLFKGGLCSEVVIIRR